MDIKPADGRTSQTPAKEGGEESSRGGPASTFTDAEKETLNKIYTDCWICKSCPPQLSFVPVVSPCDKLVDRMRQLGLLNFDVSRATDNGIGLCSNCCSSMDDPTTPGFVFVPTDLQYFIDWERQDQKRRRALSYPSSRTCPTANDYANHLRAERGTQGGPLVGGLYTRYCLHASDGGSNKTFEETRPWDGAPIAAIKRAWLATGTLDRDKIPESVRDQLSELLNLYLTDVAPGMEDDTYDADVSAPGSLTQQQGKSEEGQRKEKKSGASRVRGKLKKWLS